MRKLIILGLAALTALPACAAHRVTVSQLEQSLSSSVAKHHSDADISRQIGDLQLSERLTVRTRDRLIASLPLQSHAALALDLLADESAALDPPHGELPATVPPDAAAQQQILEATRAYVRQTVPRLPNFFATRTTVRFEDSAQVIHEGEWPVRAGFHLVGNNARTVTMRDGQEVTDSPQQVADRPDLVMGLYSFGEFGPILARTLADLAKGKIQFSHWEDSPLGVVAVFRYSVPRRESHYLVHFCCMLEHEIQGGGGSLRRMPVQPNINTPAQNLVQTKGLRAYDANPAYHGTLAIEPASGAIFRLTIDAELDPDNPIMSASTVVEYGRVLIGDQTFVCPVRSLALSSQQGPPPTEAQSVRIPILSINETTFTQYHRLGSSVRLIATEAVPNSAVPQPGPRPGPGPAPNASQPVTDAADTAAPKPAVSSEVPPPPAAKANVDPPATPAPTATAAPAATAPAANTAAEIASASPAPAAAAEPANPEIADPEISVLEASPLPDTPATSLPANNGAAPKATPRAVDVSVIAFDKKGRPVTDLQAGDFELLDAGKKQEIRFALPPDLTPRTTPSAADAAASNRTFSNRMVDSSVELASPGHTGGTVLLVDESRTASNDLAPVRSQILKFLSTLPAGERVGLYAISGAEFQPLVELTSDHAAVADKLNALGAMDHASEAERHNRQRSATTRNGAGDPADHDLPASDTDSASASFLVLEQVARHLASIPGRKNLAWFSIESEPAVPSGRKDQAASDPRILEASALHVQETMNEARTAVYPVDLSPENAGGATANIASSGLDLAAAAGEAANQASASNSARGVGGNPLYRRGPGRDPAPAQNGPAVSAVQDIVLHMAEGTGGHTIPRSGDLADALNAMAQEGRWTYRLSFIPQGDADDRYHPITVRLTSRRGITLRYRAGYMREQELPTLRERFQWAVWRPSDSTGIALSATISDASPSGNTVRLNIAAADLGMQQHANRWIDTVDIFLVQRDDAGKRSHVDSRALDLRLKEETYKNSMSAGIPFERPIEMQPGMSSVRIVVVDNNSGRIGSVTIPSSTLQPGGQAAVNPPPAKHP